MTQPISRINVDPIITTPTGMEDEQTPGSPLPASFNFNDFVNVLDEVEQEDARDAQEQYFYQAAHESNDQELTQADADMPPKEYISEFDDEQMKSVDHDVVMPQHLLSPYEMLESRPTYRELPEAADSEMTPEERAAQERLHISYERTGTEASTSTVRLIIDFVRNLLGS